MVRLSRTGEPQMSFSVIRKTIITHVISFFSRCIINNIQIHQCLSHINILSMKSSLGCDVDNQIYPLALAVIRNSLQICNLPIFLKQITI